MSVVALRQNDATSKNWAKEYLLDPLNPVEAWQTAQIGGQYSDSIPSQQSHNSTSNPFAPSSPFRDPHTVQRSSSKASSGSSATADIPTRSQSQRAPNTRQETPNRAPASRGNENYNPFRPTSPLATPSTAQPKSEHHRHRSIDTTTSNYYYRHRPRRPLADTSNTPRSPRSRGPPRQAPRYQPMRGVPIDLIDSLDTSFGGAYHHDGPFDATLAARNRIPFKSPVEATKLGNMMALEATAPADITNALEQHRPLEGVAAFPPGTVVGSGQRVSYEEYDVQRTEGGYRRWGGLSYPEGDLKGKGVEGYNGDKNEKADKLKLKKSKSLSRRRRSDEGDAEETSESLELQERNGGEEADSVPVEDIYKTTGLKRGGSTAGRLENVGAKIKRGFSLVRRVKPVTP